MAERKDKDEYFRFCLNFVGEEKELYTGFADLMLEQKWGCPYL